MSTYLRIVRCLLVAKTRAHSCALLPAHLFAQVGELREQLVASVELGQRHYKKMHELRARQQHVKSLVRASFHPHTHTLLCKCTSVRMRALNRTHASHTNTFTGGKTDYWSMAARNGCRLFWCMGPNCGGLQGQQRSSAPSPPLPRCPPSLFSPPSDAFPFVKGSVYGGFCTSS